MRISVQPLEFLYCREDFCTAIRISHGSEKGEIESMISISEMEQIILILLLFICTVMDIKKKMIYLPFIVFGAIVVTVMRLAAKELDFASVITSIVVMLIICGISVISRGQLGMGDGFLLGMAGLGLSVSDNLCMLLYCFIGVFFAAMLWVLLFHGKKESRIPLAPFVLLASILVII